MITQQVQNITFNGTQSIDILSLNNISKVDKIYFVNPDGTYVGWMSDAQHEYLQGITQLEPGLSYLVYSKAGVQFPYTLFVDPIDDAILQNSGDIVNLYDITEANSAFSSAAYDDFVSRNVALSGQVEFYKTNSIGRDDLLQSEIDGFKFLSATNDALLSTYLDNLSGLFVANTGYVTSVSGTLESIFQDSISNLVDNAPETLDTLGEIARAINENPDIGNFINTVHDATQSNNNLISQTSGVLHDKIMLESQELENSLIAASGDLHNSLVAASGDLHDSLVAASGSLYNLAVSKPRYEFDIIPNNNDPGLTTAYRWEGTGITSENQDNPTIYLRRGETYLFNIDARYHPFYIKTSRTIGAGNRYDNGVTNNGYSDRMITFTVPYDAPDTLYYQCSNHAGMGGTLYTVQPTIFNFNIDGGFADSFDVVSTTTTTTSGPTSYDTTQVIAEGQNSTGQQGGGLTFTSINSGDSISWNIITPINNPLSTTSINLFVNNAQIAIIDITDEYRYSGSSCSVTLSGVSYTVAFSAGDSSGNVYL